MSVPSRHTVHGGFGNSPYEPRSGAILQTAQLVCSLGAVGIDLQDSLELIDGQVGLAGLGEVVRQVVQRAQVLAVDLDRASQLGQRRAARARVGGRLAE